jgi:hypothetical protein
MRIAGLITLRFFGGTPKKTRETRVLQYVFTPRRASLPGPWHTIASAFAPGFGGQEKRGDNEIGANVQDFCDDFLT